MVEMREAVNNALGNLWGWWNSVRTGEDIVER